jgi:hypothetical protein
MDKIPPGRYKYTQECRFVGTPTLDEPFSTSNWLVFGPSDLMPMGHVAEVVTKDGDIVFVQILEHKSIREVHKRSGEVVRYALATWDRTVEERDLPTREDIPAALVHLLQFADDNSLTNVGSPALCADVEIVKRWLRSCGVSWG